MTIFSDKAINRWEQQVESWINVNVQPQETTGSQDGSISLIDTQISSVFSEAESEKGDVYREFWVLIREIEMLDTGFFGEISKACGVSFSSDNTDLCVLKIQFALRDIITLKSLLEWYYVLAVGFLPTAPKAQEYMHLKNYLGFDFCTDILVLPDLVPDKKLNHLSINDFCKTLDSLKIENGKTEQTLFIKILYIIDEFVALNVSCVTIPFRIKEHFDISAQLFMNTCRTGFQDMPLVEVCRWALFEAVISHFSSDVAKEGLNAIPGYWPSQIRKELFPLLSQMDSWLVKNQIAKARNSPVVSYADPFSFVTQGASDSPQKKISKIDLPGMPQWMPNGGNTCYISATLWALFFLADEEVQARIRFFQAESSEALVSLSTQQFQIEAREAFFQLYQDLASNQEKSITKTQVDTFRKAMQKTYPEHFQFPDSPFQEDAYEFLSCVMQSVLSLESCSIRAPKFHVLHTFHKPNEEPFAEPNFYNWDEALSACYNADPLQAVDVRLGEGTTDPQTLKDLVTKRRQTEAVERNAYKKEAAHLGPAYRTVIAQHTEQLLVESREKAPGYFIGRLTRFNFDYTSGTGTKRFDVVVPNALLEFHIKGQENSGEIVPYEIMAITVHNGTNIQGGHYYTYIRKQVDQEWRFYKYDDIAGATLCYDTEKVIEDAASNGYVFYYKKCTANGMLPPKLPFEDDPSQAIKEISSSSSHSKMDIGRRVADEFGAQKSHTSSAQYASTWVKTMLSDEFMVPEKSVYFTSLLSLFITIYPEAIKDQEILDQKMEHNEILHLGGLLLQCSIYLIDPIRDNELQVIEKQKPEPGYAFCHIEESPKNPSLFLFRELDGSYVVIQTQNKSLGLKDPELVKMV